jgi:PKD repeat protein
MSIPIMLQRTRDALFLALAVCAAAAVAGCNKSEDAAFSAKAERAATPTALVPRSHDLIEDSARITPLRAIAATPFEAVNNEDQAPEPLWVNAAADPDSGGAPLTVNFTADVQGGPANLRYRWDFGDNAPSAYQLSVQHTYRSPGDYVAVLTVSGPGAEESDEVSIEVSEEGFDVSIDADPDIGKAPLTVHFSAVVDDDQPGALHYQWDFGDGGRDASNPTTHTYRAPGEYTASCGVTSSQGQTGHEEVEIQVDALDEDEPAQ